MGIDIKAERDESRGDDQRRGRRDPRRAGGILRNRRGAARRRDRGGEAAGARAADQAGHVASEARATADRGVETLSETVAKNPLAALAIAAGFGFILAHLTRSDR